MADITQDSMKTRLDTLFGHDGTKTAVIKGGARGQPTTYTYGIVAPDPKDKTKDFIPADKEIARMTIDVEKGKAVIQGVVRNDDGKGQRGIRAEYKLDDEGKPITDHKDEKAPSVRLDGKPVQERHIERVVAGKREKIDESVKEQLPAKGRELMGVFEKPTLPGANNLMEQGIKDSSKKVLKNAAADITPSPAVG